MNKIEILAPAGNFESLIAAVKSGADAVYFGAKKFSARSAAMNFSVSEIKEAVSYCHIRGVRAYLTVNTLIIDEELQEALDLIIYAAHAGIDAIILQDMGLARLTRQAIPELALHASTQMTVHTPEGAKALYQAGFKRAILARELSRDEIAEIREACPIELEVFVHGALCMCVSGQCYFSSMLGARSGNRGQCAQPCRLPFSVNGKSGYALSLKDNSLVKHLPDLEEMGVTSAKIEGRMKRPEYIATAIKACREARDTNKISDETSRRLNDVFSRTGFTDGYYTGKRGKEMFGHRRHDDVIAASERLYSDIRKEYKNEPQKIGVEFSLCAKVGENPALTVSDGQNFVKVYEKNKVETALNVPTTKEQCARQLNKTGGTPYFAKNISVNIDPSAAVPISVLNSLRRDALEKLSDKRAKPRIYHTEKVKIPTSDISIQREFPFERRIRVSTCRNLKIFDDFSLIIVPLFSDVKSISKLIERGLQVAVEIPRCMFGTEEKIKRRLTELKFIGINHAVVHNIGAIPLAKECGLIIHGGSGLNITNTASALWAKEAGLTDAELSFELSLKQIEKIGSEIPLGITSLGRLPLMITRNCPNKSFGINCRNCPMQGYITDRKNFSFPFECDKQSIQIYNSVPLLLSDDLKNTGYVNFEIYNLIERDIRMVENNIDSVEKLKKIFSNGRVTNGLYHRGLK